MFVVTSGDHVSIIHLLADDRVCDPWLVQNLTHPSSGLWVYVQHAMDDVTTFSREQAENSPWPSDDLSFVGSDVDSWNWELFLLGYGDIRILPLVRVVAARLRIIIRQKLPSSHGRQVIGGFGSQQFAGVMSRSWVGCEELVRVVRHAGDLPGEAAQGHAAEDDGERPNVDLLGIVLFGVVHLGGQIWVGTNNA